MLYKKYHRNFIRRFKKGVKCCRPYSPLTEIYEIVKEPYYSNVNHRIEFQSSSYFCVWPLIFSWGSINYKIRILNAV